MDLATLAEMMRQQFDGLNQRVDNLQDSLNTRVDILQCTLFHQSNELQDSLIRRRDETVDRRSTVLQESLLQRSNQLEESLVQRSNQIHDSMLQRANELDNTLIQRNNEELDISLSQRNDVFQDSLARRIDDTMHRRSNELQGFWAQRLDDTMAQRTEVLQKNLVQEMFNFHNSVIRPLFDGIYGKLAAHHRDIQREFQNVNERYDRVDARIDTLDMDMKREFNNINERFTHVEDRFNKLETKVKQLEVKIDRVEAKIDRLEDRLDKVETKVEVQMGNFKGILRNSKIAFLNQRIFPIQVYDSDGSPMPISVASLPATALGFYHLKESKHYTELESTEQELEHAISSNACGVLVLSGRIGIDCDALHDRVIQFHAQKNASSKRDASDLSSTNDWAAKIHHPLPVRVRPASESQPEADVREPSALSRVCWEVDSEKFKQSLDPELGVARISLRLSQNSA
ncbi:hypothetical protein AARAC_008783 [Aspergillus arachidicola]|uniref:Uncharacterized protein n=1 Tax=Aspergillus arachidicola TaxID=656916 RepID=A0A2G7G8E4_9EURO|nr:hypothetical protein AARAC_008783 [Aspergillus arachidicola]